MISVSVNKLKHEDTDVPSVNVQNIVCIAGDYSMTGGKRMPTHCCLGKFLFLLQDAYYILSG